MAGCKDGEIPPKNAKFFNSLPHVNFNFDNISTTFRPTDKDYQQNLIVYSVVPAIIGVIFFTIIGICFIVYCCSWCCKRCKKQITRRKTKTKCAICLSVCIGISALLCVGIIISGFVINDGIDNGVHTVTKAMSNVTDIFDSIHDDVSGIQNDILDIKENIDEMLNLPDMPYSARYYLENIKSSILKIIEKLNGVKTVETPDISGDVKTGEYYRWWTTFGVFGLATITCVFVVYSSVRHSRCGFFLSLLLGCLTFLLNWLVIGAYLGASIGMSDLCVAPIKTIHFYLETSSTATKDIVNYYLKCKPGSRHPYEKYIDQSFDFALRADQDLQKLQNELNETVLPPDILPDVNKLTSDFHDMEFSLNGVRKDMKCTRIKQEYDKAHCAVCYPVVGGLTNLLVISLVLVVVLAIMLNLIAPLCKRIHKKKRPRNFGNSMLNGQSEETEYLSVSSDDESMPLIPSPPPPPYEAIPGSVDFQFHSCQEPRNRAQSSPPQQVYEPYDQHQDAASNQENNLDPPPLRGEVVPIQRRVTMAF